jgi:hypothetical protein
MGEMYSYRILVKKVRLKYQEGNGSVRLRRILGRYLSGSVVVAETSSGSCPVTGGIIGVELLALLIVLM